MVLIANRLIRPGLVLGAGLVIGAPALADQVILDDLIVDGSICVGQDCVNGESFGFDTLRLKENNLRIKAQDTSTSASFPTNDWQITFNDSSNGGANKFSIDDIDGGRTPFTIEAGTPSHALYVDSGGSKGRIGFGTNTPVTDLHVVSGNTPTLRLEQDGSSGFQAQIWDVAGNEAGFFVRDATNGSQLAFRIRPGADASSIDIAANNDVGVGTSGPNASLHVIGDAIFDQTDAGDAPVGSALLVRRNDGTAQVYVQETSAVLSNTRIQLKMENKGAAQFALIDTDRETDWRFQNFEDQFRVVKAGTGVTELTLDAAGNMTILGALTENSDKNAKMAIEPVDPDAILEKVAALPVSEWSYIDTAGVRHIGPMAQDFHAMFGLGAGETGISTLDTSGVALAAIKALAERNASQAALIAELTTRIEELEAPRD